MRRRVGATQPIDTATGVSGLVCAQRFTMRATERLDQIYGDLAAEQPVPVLGEGRVIPHLVVHLEGDEPAQQQAIVDLLHQLPLAADRVQRHQQLLRRDRVATQAGIQRVEAPVHFPQRRIRHRPYRAQRMILRYPRIRTDRAEQGILLDIGRASCGLSSWLDSRYLRRKAGNFNGLLVLGFLMRVVCKLACAD